MRTMLVALALNAGCGGGSESREVPHLGEEAGTDASSDASTADVYSGPCPILGAPPTTPSDPDCPAGRGRPMVRVGAFCIDATEVTNADYRKFLDDFDKPKSLPVCAGNAYELTLTTVSSAGRCPDTFDPVGKPQHPVACVDWCDAWAYCAWAGKRLCGRIGGGSAMFDTFDPAQNEWLFACTGGGKHRYPYGDVATPGLCNGIACSPMSVPVGASAKCHGAEPPFDRVYDMIGNSNSWIDACDGPTPDALCSIAGWGITRWAADDGTMPTTEQQSCDALAHPTRNQEGFADLGIRCCADPVAGDAGTLSDSTGEDGDAGAD